MKITSLSTFSLMLLFSQISLASPPDLSNINMEKILRLGIGSVEKIDDKCYAVRHDFCHKETTYKNCATDENLENHTIIQLKKMTFALVSRTLNSNHEDVLVYKAVPNSPKIKEEDLYKIQGTKTPSPLRYYITLKETSCLVPVIPRPDIPQFRATVTPEAKNFPPKDVANGAPQPTDSVAIPQNNEAARKNALKFLMRDYPKPNRAP